MSEGEGESDNEAFSMQLILRALLFIGSGSPDDIVLGLHSMLLAKLIPLNRK